MTLVLQGLTLPAVVKMLGLDDAANNAAACEENEARRIVLEAAITFLEENRAAVPEGESHPYDDLLHVYRHRLESVADCNAPTTSQEPSSAQTAHLVMLQTVQCERQELIKLRNSGRIGDAVRRTLERELDLSESRLALQAEALR